jgi:hypothetical protein
LITSVSRVQNRDAENFSSAAAPYPYIHPGCVEMIDPVAVLHVTYKPAAGSDSEVYDGFSDVLKSYQWIRLSKSNWAINTS